MSSRLDLGSFVRKDMAGFRSARRVQNAVIALWAMEARAGLGVSSRSTSEYVRSIGPAAGDGYVRVELVGTFPNMLEQGMGPGGVGTEGPYNLADVILKAGTQNLQQTRDGRMFVNVPFSHSAAAIKAAGGGGKTGAGAYAAAKSLAPAVMGADGRTAWGGRLPAGVVPKLRDDHATDPLAGLVRIQAGYSQGVSQSQYRTFRRLIQGGKAWMHPGIRARHIASKVVERVPYAVSALFGAAGSR